MKMKKYVAGLVTLATISFGQGLTVSVQAGGTSMVEIPDTKIPQENTVLALILWI